MAGRKYDFTHLTDTQLDALAKMYPKAVNTVTIRMPVYNQLRMIVECGAPLPEGVQLEILDNESQTDLLTAIKAK